ncbi:Glycosyl transferase group 1 [Myroides sp. A21]|uniref:glycosyltransferase n=1 Tax=Myroides sp. A21 TaxID=1583100 RepID=UPI00057F6829|nr:glycosyltransferase [Myroides sp. A21]AJA70390.1 Glycosyl transferase group 1 [Myroides sp. A21]
MILIDALYINNGGGKILLNYLVNVLEQQQESVYYLFDIRCKNDYSDIPNEKKHYMKASTGMRYKFYSKNRNTFTKVLCFGNLPPLRGLNCEVYTYFHQPMYLNIPKEFGIKQRSLFKAKQTFLNLCKQNTDYWLVQNNGMKEALSKRYGLDLKNVLIKAFYPNEDLVKNTEAQIKNTFIYVSGGAPHKNHARLINAFCDFFDKYKEGELILTVGKEHQDITITISEKKKNGYPIRNIGFVGREELISNYHKAEYLVFPSLEESFGLGIVEAIECGCKVIGADLPYMYQVCDPSIIFNPFDVESIVDAFGKAIKKEEKETKQRIFNEIDQLIWLLKK